MNVVIHTDGGARGNPGPAAVGVVITIDNARTVQFGKTIGQATNNVAEYTAVSEALQKLKELGNISEADFYLDSVLVVNQLNGLFKVKNPALRTLLSKIRILEQEVGGKIQYHVIKREQNRRADFLVNQALDRDI